MNVMILTLFSISIYDLPEKLRYRNYIYIYIYIYIKLDGRKHYFGNGSPPRSLQPSLDNRVLGRDESSTTTQLLLSYLYVDGRTLDTNGILNPVADIFITQPPIATITCVDDHDLDIVRIMQQLFDKIAYFKLSSKYT